jgi:hypothetical protein
MRRRLSLFVFLDVWGLGGHGSSVPYGCKVLDASAGCRVFVAFAAIRSALLSLLQDALDLLEVVEVVAGHHVQDALDGFFAALGVHAVMLPLFGL